MKQFRNISRPNLLVAILVSVVVVLVGAILTGVTILAVNESNNDEAACKSTGGIYTSHYIGSTLVGKVQVPNFTYSCETR